MQPRPQKRGSPDSDNTVARLQFKAWFGEWKNGRGNYQPDSPEFHLAPGLKLKDVARAYTEYTRGRDEPCPSPPSVYRWLAVDFPHVKKRKWCRFTKCSICSKLDDRIEKAKPDARRVGTPFVYHTKKTLPLDFCMIVSGCFCRIIKFGKSKRPRPPNRRVRGPVRVIPSYLLGVMILRCIPVVARFIYCGEC